MKRSNWLWCLMIAVLVMILFVALVVTKKVKLNSLLVKLYEVQGIDVSHYQGDIDWKKIEEQKIDFAFIKATEGSSYVDTQFRTNWQAAGQTQINVGAYHFFSFDSDAKMQAQLYMDTVGDLSGRMIPVVDVEYYGDKAKYPPKREIVVEELQEMLNLLEEHYGVKPMIYTTYQVYYKYIKGGFDEYPLWIRNVYYSPNVDIGNEWEVWQYSDTAVLKGYQGNEKYIDRNVFNGTKEEFKALMVP